MLKTRVLLLAVLSLITTIGSAQIINVGSGSYTTSFPGTDEAGRNGFPSGTPQLSGDVMDKPVPTNDWWSKLLKENHADNLFNYPLSMRTLPEGLVVADIVPTSGPNGSSQPIGDARPIIVGVANLNASRVTVNDYSDWTVTMNWSGGDQYLDATSGIGMPFLYFETTAANSAAITVNEGSISIDGEIVTITNSQGGSDYAVYAPSGSTWSRSGNRLTSELNGQTYWSMAKLPEGSQSTASKVERYRKYAYVFPKSTKTAWEYQEETSVLKNTFTVETDVKEGTETDVIMGLLPHQWAHLAPESSQPTDLSYSTIRGELKVLEGNQFVVEHTFKGILPTLPYVDNYSESFNPTDLTQKIDQIKNDGLATWTDSYNEGQVMNRLIQSARVADEMGNTEARDIMVQTVRNRLEDWLKAESGEVAFIYYYNSDWSTMIGYPAGHGQDNNINDHHFHWGYFIHAAAFVEQYEPGWSDEWGDMINLLVRDAASPNRDDDTFPFLRNFSPYAGHSWANGFATFPFGNDQESTSESMQFASSLIHWGSVTDNKEIRDLGIYIYTIEQSATEEYWFDIHNRTFKNGYGYKLASRIWGNGYDNQTFWTSDISAAYGIELYPIHGGSLYLGHNQDYAQSLWDEIASNTGIMSNEANPNLWHDTYWKYLSMIDATAALELYNSYPDRDFKFGISDVQTYHWLHAMNVLGSINTDITADHPIAASFAKDGQIIYVAQNYSDTPITVTYSDGYHLEVPAGELITSLDVEIRGELTSDFAFAFPGGSVWLTAEVTGGQATKVEFFDGADLIGQSTEEPYQIKAENLSLGIHGMYAKVYLNDNFNTTNVVTVQVGDQVPYESTFQIPGTIEAGHFDRFEGGSGQGICYLDTSPGNNGNYRLDEDVDCENNSQEGPALGWISAGEWLEYDIAVETSGYYEMTFRYASNNSAGGGPFHFELDGTVISPSISMTSTNGWDTWQDRVMSDIELTEGEHTLRLVITNGEFNLARMNFEYQSPLDYVPPIADAGANVTVMLPTTSTMLDGSLSGDPNGQVITYQWTQIYGPSSVSYDDQTTSQPNISGLEVGVYKFRLQVSDGQYQSDDEVLVIVTSNGNLNPTISISNISNGQEFREQESITIETSTSDIDGTIALVEFYANGEKIGEDTSEPFSVQWDDAPIGNHTLAAVASDDQGDQGESAPVSISVIDVQICQETSAEAQQGSFSEGYNASFETAGSTVKVAFELLDTDKQGVVAFLWQQTPFTEYEMTSEGGLRFSKTFGGLTDGEELSLACKFAFAGGLSATKYISYIVGQDCGFTATDDRDVGYFTIYPNPANDVLYIEGLSKTSQVTIHSAIGQQLSRHNTTNTIDISELNSGIYFLTVVIDDRRVTKKFIKK